MKWSIPERIVERGRAYADAGRVVSIEADRKMMLWRAEVIGSEVYHVELDGTTKEKDFCTCRYNQEHGYCKHTVAAELFLKKQGLSRVILANHSLGDHEAKTRPFSQLFTEKFVKFQEKEKQDDQTIVKEYFTIQVHCEIVEGKTGENEEDLLGIWLKIAIDQSKKRSYIIKNISQFLQLYEKQDDYQFGRDGKKNRLTHVSFSAGEQQILNYLIKILNGTEQLKRMINQTTSGRGKQDQRFLILTEENAKEVLELAQRFNLLNFHQESATFLELKFTSEKSPLFFDFTTYQDGYQLTIERNQFTYLANYHWLVGNQMVYLLNYEEEQVYRLLNDLLKRTEEEKIFFQKEEVPDLFSHVIPELEKIGEVKIAEDVRQSLIIYPLATVFTIDYLQPDVRIRVDFHYGKYVFSSQTSSVNLPQPTEDPIVIRDDKLEKTICHYLEKQRFNLLAGFYHRSMVENSELYGFFRYVLPKLKQLGSVRLDPLLENMLLDGEKYVPRIAVSESDSWLDIRFDVSNIPQAEIDDVLKSMLAKAPYHVLQTGQILPLETSAYQETSQALQKLRGQLTLHDGVAKLPKYQGLQIENAVSDLEQTEFNRSFLTFVKNLTHPETYEAVLPQGLKAELREYQQIGFQWLKMLSHYQLGGILADEMGLGKTLQSIVFLLSEKENQKFCNQTLIIAPASLLYNWQMELQKFTPLLKTTVVIGTKEQRKAIIENAQMGEILIASYASARLDQKLYNTITLDYLILDEAQAVKNSSSKTFMAIRDLQATHRFALSGTPIENKMEELWSLFQLLMPGFFPPKKIFLHMKTQEVAKMIQPFVMRREKKQVLQDLPDKIESNLYSVLTEEQKKIYLAHLQQIQLNIGNMNPTEFQKNRMSILAALTRLRQICCDPSLFLPEYTGGSGKVEQVKQLLITAKENQRRVLVFSQFTSMLERLEKEFASIGLSTFYLHGGTKPRKRIEMVEQFNQGERDVFLISLKAGGTGLNLTGADTVVLYDLWWNPAIEEQAASRAHRMGQKKVVDVWRLIAEGTIEEKMYTLQQEKKELFQKVLQAGKEDELKRLTEEDIREILSMGEGLD